MCYKENNKLAKITRPTDNFGSESLTTDVSNDTKLWVNISLKKNSRCIQLRAKIY